MQKKPVKIYRFETKDGIGMYAATRVAHDMSMSQHPTPSADYKLWRKLKQTAQKQHTDPAVAIRKYNFGFSSKAQMKRWVSRKTWLKALHKEGILISEYVCPHSDVIKGSTQAIFKRHISKQQFSIEEYFGLDKNKYLKYDGPTLKGN